jgi:hypothetical protein
MQDQIGYDKIIESAMRNVISNVLRKVNNTGLIGEHHFVINFSTKHPGVIVSEEIKKKFPSDMTIIIQHQFQSLQILDDCFKVTLSFSGQSEFLTIPYKAIYSFGDPSVNFGLKFNHTEDTDEEENFFLKENAETNNVDSDLLGKVISLADFKKNRDKDSKK